MKKHAYLLIVGLIVGCFSDGFSGLRSCQLNVAGAERISSNGITDILIDGSNVWVATGQGLVRTTDGGSTWDLWGQEDGIGKGSVTAICAGHDMIWIATGFDTTTDLGSYDAGGGVGYSRDSENWVWYSQPVDSQNVEDYDPTTTNIQNLTYDIAITDDAIWIASFGGGFRRSTNLGRTWTPVTVDGNPFSSLDYLAHRAFAVMYDGSNLWAGSADGVHKSEDGGESWVTFNRQNQTSPISGNFVVALANQEWEDRSFVWAASVEALDSIEVRGVSMTEDGGLTWKTMLEGLFAHNFAFDGPDAYVATDKGLYKSQDFGDTWAVFPNIVDDESGEEIYSDEITCAAVDETGVLWVGSLDGLARSTDGGATWTIFRAFETPGESGVLETYAYPNPFSPLRHNTRGGDGYVRFQYAVDKPSKITVKIYDFGMNLVQIIADNKDRSSAGDYSEVWDGKNELGDMVANGVYFYQVIRSGHASLWGKVMVVN